MPWFRSNREIGILYGVRARVVWRWRKKLGKINVPCQRGPDRKSRAHWDWSLPAIQLAKIHGVSRARVYQLKQLVRSGKFRDVRSALIRWKK